MELRRRRDVPVEETWDLTPLYPDSASLQADCEKIRAMSEEIAAEFSGKLTNSAAIHRCLDRYRALLTLLDRAGNYCGLSAAVDFGDAALQEQDEAVERLAAQVRSRLRFIDSEILAQDENVLHAAILRGGPNGPYLRDLLRRRPHQLQPETERVLSALAPTLRAPYQVYNMAKLADMRFPPFEAAGETFPLGYSLYEDRYAYDPRTEVRRAAFDAFSKKLKDYENVTAAAYQATVQSEKILAGQRGFASVFDSLLFPQKVSRAMYERQIDCVMERLAPHMRRYAKLLQRIHGLDRMTYADLMLSVDPAYDPKVTIAEARTYIAEGLSVLGPDYQEMVRRAFDERWVDFAQNQGKSTGGFCATPYTTHAFILLSWHERMSDVMTLAHELGHAGHFAACNAAQPLFSVECSMYCIEAPSTMNELLLAHHLIKTNPDKRFRRWVLDCMVGKTYYHNFVTHLLEAAYQREVYRIVDAGGGVQAETLNRLYRETLEKFWGDAVELTPGCERTWMRQPHYYEGLYSYTYSAGLTVATQACKRIEAEGAPAVEDWKRVLAAGGSQTPLQLARTAGVDISTDAPLLDTIETIGGMIDEICRLTEELP